MKSMTLLTWSGGKDSAMALYKLQKSEDYDITALLTTVTEGYDRISMHGVRRTLLENQAEALGYPLEIVTISQKSSNEEYEQRMKEALLKYKNRGVETVAFGDIYLEDVRKYREENLSKVDMRGIFPLWGKNTSELAMEFVKLGFRAVVTCVDSQMLDGSFSGRIIDEEFLEDLPEGVDPCGENGEFHSFVFDGPVFNKAVKFTKGEVVLRDERFFYCDLLDD
jgi:uncharacterized protein (TIGR00290 family)